MWITKNGESRNFYDPEDLQVFLEGLQNQTQSMDTATPIHPDMLRPLPDVTLSTPASEVVGRTDGPLWTPTLGGETWRGSRRVTTIGSSAPRLAYRTPSEGTGEACRSAGNRTGAWTTPRLIGGVNGPSAVIRGGSSRGRVSWACGLSRGAARPREEERLERLGPDALAETSLRCARSAAAAP
ncbi:hypothetical protein NDU88_002645 [Pleurodeles waltl]|uniref:Uncharacterized protein n=1 Tax=Pleurodeles waltl TaxID=8319 RepID=A0AAV7MNZ9_PLEWA|nr:hypothetical protein NDU88_002645 [Pleurodeles waltl]